MLRKLQTISNKNADAMFKAGVAMKRGMLVQKDYTNKVAILPVSQEGLFFATRDNYPMGLMAAEGELSDYDSRFETFAEGDGVILEKPFAGERYAIDQYISTDLVVGDYLIAEVTIGANQGKLKKNATATNFKYCGTMSDNGNTLAIVEVL
jgi:hypothetical protein